MSQGRAPCRGSRGGSSLPLPASGGSRHPSLGWWLPPSLSASVFMWLLLCVPVSPLLCLLRTLSLGLGPPPSKRTSSQTLHFITSAEILFEIRPHSEFSAEFFRRMLFNQGNCPSPGGPEISRVSLSLGFPSKESAYSEGDRFPAWVGKTPWRRAWQPTPAFWPGESRGQRSLEGYLPWGLQESDTTEAT